MKKAILDTQRVNTQFDIDMLQAKNQIILEAAGIQHHLDVEAIVGGGYVVTIWVDDAIVESGEYIVRMLDGLERIERACRVLERTMLEQRRIAAVDEMLNSPEGLAAANQVADFFAGTRH